MADKVGRTSQTTEIITMKTNSVIKDFPNQPRVLTRVLFAVAVCICHSSFAQESTRSTERIYQFNDRGDATVEFDFGFDKASWDMWRSQYGDHPDVLLRFMKHDMAAAVIEDFALEKDDTNRKAVARFKARAWANYRGNNQ